MVNYLLDTYAWIEYSQASNKGRIVERLLADEDNKFFTAECCVSEIRAWTLKNTLDFSSIFTVIKSNSVLLPLHLEHWIAAAKERHEEQKTHRDFGIVDALIVCVQKEIAATLITEDHYFRGRKGVLFLE